MSNQVDIDLTSSNSSIKGQCDDRFANVLEEFTHNFEERGELGASICLNVEGETVVDLWGGKCTRRPDAADWAKDTVSVVFSSTKGAVSICAHLLIAEGRLDPRVKVTDYWPEFGAAGKEDVTVAMMLNHSAGLPALRDKVKDGGYLEWDYMDLRFFHATWPLHSIP